MDDCSIGTPQVFVLVILDVDVSRRLRLDPGNLQDEREPALTQRWFSSPKHPLVSSIVDAAVSCLQG